MVVMTAPAPLPVVDLEHPPVTPPENSLLLLWIVSRALWAEHQAGADGHCAATTCRETYKPWPCPDFSLAKGGLLAAVMPAPTPRRCR